MVVYPADKSRTTVKECTVSDPQSKRRGRNLGNQISNTQAYTFDTVLPKTTIKELDVEKTTLTSTFSKKDAAYTVTDVNVPNTLRQFTGSTKYVGSMEAQHSKKGGYNVSNYEVEPTQRQSISEMTYSASAKSVAGERPPSYDDFYNADISSKQEEIIVSREPTDTGNKEYVGKEMVEDTVQIVSTETESNWVPITTRTPTIYQSVSPDSLTKDKQNTENDIETERINPDILQAFKDNPYTQSLSSTN